MEKKIGFIGLGRMGLPMAVNLCKAGFHVFVCSSKRESQQRILEAGGQAVESFAKMAEICDVIITIVPADAEILELYKGENNMLRGARAGLTCIDMTSAKGITKREIDEQIRETRPDIAFIDAPVSGGVAGARNAALTIMVGCDEALYEANMDVFRAMGQKIIHTGAVGSGSDIKMLNQMLNAANTAIAAEVLCLSRMLGIEDKTLSAVVNESSGGSFVFQKNVPKYMMTGEHTPGFALALMEKDVGLFADTAAELKAFTPVASLVYQLYKAVDNAGRGKENYTAIHKWLEENQPKA